MKSIKKKGKEGVCDNSKAVMHIYIYIYILHAVRMFVNIEA